MASRFLAADVPRRMSPKTSTLQWPRDCCRADQTAVLTCSRLQMSAGELRSRQCCTTSWSTCGATCIAVCHSTCETERKANVAVLTMACAAPQHRKGCMEECAWRHTCDRMQQTGATTTAAAFEISDSWIAARVVVAVLGQLMHDAGRMDDARSYAWPRHLRPWPRHDQREGVGSLASCLAGGAACSTL